MDFDKSAYILYHSAQTGFPCLSFDIIPDEDGSGEERLDKDTISTFMVAGTQAPKAHLNTIHVLHMSRMSKFKKRDSDLESDEDSESSDDDDEPDSQPVLKSSEIPHPWGGINRIRFTDFNSNMLAASWCDSGRVRIWNLNKQLQELKNTFFNKSEAPPPIFTFSGHQTEGFALDWSNIKKGHLATGDCAKNIHIWTPNDEGTWHVDQTPLIGHTGSVEDIQWSPTEPNVLASCSVDKSIRIWDTRARANPSASCMITIADAHESDVNVISWNRLDTFFLLSGGDDGAIKVWDFRKFVNASKQSKPIATFKHHLAPITSIEWHPSDNTVFGASGEDHQITLWDLAVEKDDEEMESEEIPKDEDEDEKKDELDEEEKNAPPQLLFVHKGQRDVKEIHFHPQIPGLVISTAANSFDIFKTISV